MNFLLLINSNGIIAAHGIYDTYDEAYARGVALGVNFQVVPA
jgi:hypothetical protein